MCDNHSNRIYIYTPEGLWDDMCWAKEFTEEILTDNFFLNPWGRITYKYYINDWVNRAIDATLESYGRNDYLWDEKEYWYE